jgi:hypothetical protein
METDQMTNPTSPGGAGEALVDDYEWAYQRVVDLCANALADAQVYRQKLLKGFGYPNETFRAAQDYRALRIVLDRLTEQSRQQEAWQPIETAPEGAMALFCSMTTGDVSKWCFVDWRAGGRFMLHQKWDATHWMPLAAPPQPKEPR